MWSDRACRMEDDLCSPDPSFHFGSLHADSLTDSPDTVKVQIRRSNLYFLSQLGLSPLSLRSGDYNLDGYPDLLIPMVKGPETSSSPNATEDSVIQGKREGDRVMTLWQNIPCTVVLCGRSATMKGRRTFRQVIGKEVAGLHSVSDPILGTFFDVDETGSPDLLVLSDPLTSDLKTSRE
eukprot:CAMPEP_0201531390 /NCGR_PEP_ID=MMETSP0161_2-20130828/47485_1 /ASSEMBLY_ACC=CAM_ASM_000251 /TAXON_ID=180227 /ORGANISM="Neoparamoeba aestuarina, Strain SoJaBio B1-5/56/2" /LENGTH=178 /DNA_ID=CAMNT_0047934281 /DNA_START=65 /DNA_END=598 /DNA_ORIENTATION=+